MSNSKEHSESTNPEYVDPRTLFSEEEIEEKLKEFRFDVVIARALSEEPFFATLSRHIAKIPNENISTAGVRINPNTLHFELMYNPLFMACLPLDHQIGVLYHEFYHLILDHVTGRLPGGKITKRWNFAADLAINGPIEHLLPEWVLLPGRGPFKDYPPKLSAERYYAMLLNDPQFQDGDGNFSESGEGFEASPGEGQLDDHSGWDELSPEEKTIAKERLKTALREAAQEADKSAQWGSISADMRKNVRKFISTSVNWRAVLRYFVQQSQKAEAYSTVRKINRRYPYVHSGRSKRRTAKIAISIDQSGSVSNELLSEFFAELNSLAKIAHFTVVPFDTRVEDSLVFEWKKGQSNPPVRTMCGGTDFSAPTKWVNERNFDGHIVLTDLEAPFPGRSKCQRMWMTDETHAGRGFPSGKNSCNERVIAISPKKKV